MKIFVTGATGFIGEAVVKELLGAGHKVLGLARTEEKAAGLKKLGAEPVIGSLADLDVLKKTAKEADGVAHLAFIHDFANFAESIRADKAAVAAFAEALEGSNKPLVVTFGTAGQKLGELAHEKDEPTKEGFGAGRSSTEQAVLEAAKNGVRSVVMRLPPTVHGEHDHGFVAALVGMARKNGFAGYVGEGKNVWPAVHRVDAARLYRLALEKAKPGMRLHAVAEEGIPFKKIAEAMAEGLGIPAKSLTPEDAQKELGFLGGFAQLDNPTSSAATRKEFDWSPKEPELLADIKAHYTK